MVPKQPQCRVKTAVVQKLDIGSNVVLNDIRILI